MSPSCISANCVLPDNSEFLTIPCLRVPHEGKHASKSCQEVYSTRKKRIHFANVEIRYYPIIIGDSPSVSDGCPVTIDWEPIGISVASVDEFETFRLKSRMRHSDMIMNEMTRYQILLDAGYNVLDILNGERSARLLKEERMFSYYTKVVQKRLIHAAFELRNDDYDEASKTV